VELTINTCRDSRCNINTHKHKLGPEPIFSYHPRTALAFSSLTMNENQPQLLSKIATGNGHGEDSPYFDGWRAYQDDPFHPIKNPNGVIQMGLAENQVYDQINLLLILSFCENSCYCKTQRVWTISYYIFCSLLRSWFSIG